MLDLIELLVHFVWEALTVYAASAEGVAEIKGILDAVEGAGIDIPFYEPSQPNGSEEGDNGASESLDDRLARFVREHPEVANK